MCGAMCDTTLLASCSAPQHNRVARGLARGRWVWASGDTAMLLAVAALMSSSPACSSVMASPFEPRELPPPRSARCACLSLQCTPPQRNSGAERGPDEKREAPSHQAAAAAAVAAAAAQHAGSSTTSETVTLSNARRFRINVNPPLSREHVHDCPCPIGLKVFVFRFREQ